MPLRLEIKKKFSSRSERVKSVDFHSQEPWIVAALYSGHVFIWNHQTQATVKTLEVCDLPVRCAKFIDRKQWVVCGADDLQIRVYNYNTMERVKTFEAHTDYIRCIAVHPTLPYILTSSDDMSIKLWDWEKGWECQTIFEGHTHYVMQVEFNPKDTNTFASASLDRTVKVWGLNSGNPHFSLEGHERGVNCIAYFRGGDRPYLLSGADDNLVKIWDYQTKTCVATLEGHTNNVSAVSFHPTLPIILTGAEDGTVRIWHATTYRLENTLNYGMERVWSIACLRGSNRVAIGYDEGTIMIKLGHEEPVVSMEKGGKIVWAKNNEIVIANVKQANLAETGDGDRLPVQTKELGSCEVYPQSIKHNPNGRLLCVCGDGEFIIYTALSLRNTSFGTALEFVWSTDSGVYGTRESSSKVKVFKNFKEHKSFRPTFAAEGIFGGNLLGVRSSDFIDFYDWNECRVVRRIDVCPRKVYWSDSGDMAVLCCDSSYYVLRYNSELVGKFFDQNVEIGEQGIEGAFDLEQEISEKVRNGYFVGDCFLYTNSAGRLNYYVGGEVMTLAHLPKSMYLLGYLAKENRVYLMDKQYNTYSYSLLVSVLVYQTAIVRQDFEAAAKALAQIPDDQHNKMARFLEAQDLKEMALQVSKDPEHKFELAMQCKKLHEAREIIVESESEQKWRQLGDAALNQDFDLKLAEECFTRCKDLGSLLLLHTSMSNRAGIASLAEMAKEIGHNNVAFLCYFQLGRVEDCINLLCDTGRIPEAAFMARTYLPSHVPRILELWKTDLKKVSKNASDSLADPREHKDLFPNLDAGLGIEQYCLTSYKTPGLASQYPTLKNGLNRDLLTEFKENKLSLSMPPPSSLPNASSSSSSSTTSSSSLRATPSGTSPSTLTPATPIKPTVVGTTATPATAATPLKSSTPTPTSSATPTAAPSTPVSSAAQPVSQSALERTKSGDTADKSKAATAAAAEKVRKEKEAADAAAKQQAEKEKAEKERKEKEAAAEALAARLQADKDKAEKERQEKERQEKEKEKARQEKERKEKEILETKQKAAAAAAAEKLQKETEAREKERKDKEAAAAAAAALAARSVSPAKPPTTTAATSSKKSVLAHDEEEEEEEEDHLTPFSTKKDTSAPQQSAKKQTAAAAVASIDKEAEEDENEEEHEEKHKSGHHSSTVEPEEEEENEEEEDITQFSTHKLPPASARKPAVSSLASKITASAPKSAPPTAQKPAVAAAATQKTPPVEDEDDEGPSMEELDSRLGAIDVDEDWGKF